MLEESEKQLGVLMHWPPHWGYDYANVVIVDPKTGNIFLSRSEDREEYTPYGGELEFDEQPEKGACRETIEETGGLVNPSPNDLLIVKTVRVIPEKKIGGITSQITTFVYFLTDNDKHPNINHQEHEEGCKIIDVIEISLPELYQQIEMREIKLFSNFISILPDIEEKINEHL